MRMDSHKIANKQHTRFVSKTEQTNSNSNGSQKILENQLSAISKNKNLYRKEKMKNVLFNHHNLPEAALAIKKTANLKS